MLTACDKNERSEIMSVSSVNPTVSTIKCSPDGAIPNSTLPVIVYKNAYKGQSSDAIVAQMKPNGWNHFWINGVYGYHHYHSNTHEILVCLQGSATVLFGGDNGTKATLEAGDAVLIPAGVAHKKLSSTWGFSIMGGYPQGFSPNMRYCKESELTSSLAEIAKVPKPAKDPVLGEQGGTNKLW